MSKHNHKKSRLKYIFLAFTCAATFAFSGIAAACGNTTEEEKEKTTTKEDTQLLKNGNFEFFKIPEKVEGGNEPVYLIKSPDNWSHGGTNSYTMSGIISTSKSAWDKMVNPNLADDLDYNNKLESSSSNYLSEYVDYNGMKSSDILYKDQYEALRTEDDYKEDEEIPEDRKDTIANPETHYGVHEKDGKLYAYVDGEEKLVYEDENGEYFLEYNEEKDEYSKPISNILMLHNYATAHNGIAQNYSSIDVELPANTAAEVSVWVKTAHLKFSQGKDVQQDRGANITVTQSVGGSSLDNFTISCINTEKLIKEGKAVDTYNGWVQYTVYINACDFAATNIKIQLGLGETGYTTEGYAFFDDVSVTKYVSLEQSATYDEKNVEKTTCVLSTDASEKVYKADSYIRNEGMASEKKEERYSNNFHYLIDLASEKSEGAHAYVPVDFEDVESLKAGLTIDKDSYVSSKNFDFSTNLGHFDYSGTRLPFASDLKNNGLKTKGDYLAYVNTNHQFTKADTDYYEKLNKALNSADNLPKNSNINNNNMLVMLSSYGAAYTTSFDLSIPAEGYQIISFWVKTSDMKGSTAATIKITQDGNNDNHSNFTLDTTDMVTNIGDKDEEKDIYDGWVQCFFFVKNELESDSVFNVEFSFGNTTINGTDVHSYKQGWVALANMQCLEVDEDIFSYTGSGEHTASLTISEEAEKNTKAFDSPYGNQSSEIKDGPVLPSSYTGVNGASSAVVNNGSISIPYDEFNNNVDSDGNVFTGLIRKDHFVDGNYGQSTDAGSLYKTLLDSFNPSSIDATVAWNEIFGSKSYQPLIITNTTKTRYIEEKGATADTYKNYLIKDANGNYIPVPDGAEFDENETYYRNVRNYGYLGSNTSVSSSNYSTISIKVKASANAVAYVYLVDTAAGKNVLSFSAPTYSFYYDIEGNVLKAEPKDNATVKEQRENILYTLRDDGLYEDKDGTLYANTWNYSKLYYAENADYYDEAGNKFSIEDLVDGVTYYDSADAATRKMADHYLVTTSGIKVYQCIGGEYHYIVEGKAQSEVVKPFNTEYARYDFTKTFDDSSYKYMAEVVGADHLDANGVPQWVTVTFVIHAGSEAKSYRLELWSGKRDETGVDNNTTVDPKDPGTVIFDYSYASISDNTMRDYYEKQIINAYLKAFAAAGKSDLLSSDTTGKNILYYEKLAKDNGIEIDNEYKALYYTYSLYDSANFQPFNRNVAGENSTGYDYSAADQTETLAYLLVNDKERNEYTVFADYSEIDKAISLSNSTDKDDDHDHDDDKGSDGSIWLLTSSIILVIALIFAIIAIFVRDAVKKSRRNKVTSKNNYDHRKVNRYKRKLHLKQETIEEVDGDSAEAPAEEEPEEVEEVNETAEEVTETPVEEAPAEEVTEAPEEAPAEETPESEPSDGEEKPE